MIADRVLTGKRIFVVEDDVANMAIITFLLKHQGALVIQDHWNATTMNLIRQHAPIDAILLDLMLRRGLSGYDIFGQLQQDPALASIPVIAVSASDPAIEIPRAQTLGLAGFLSKPLHMERFPHQVLRCMESQPIWDTGQ